MKVLIAASECSPLVKVGGIADVIGSIPIALHQHGVDVRVAIPLYKNLIDKINATDNSIVILRKKDEIQVKYGTKERKVDLFETYLPGTAIPVYLIYNEDLISNGGIYFTPKTMPSPEMELDRFALFSKIVAQYFTYPNNVFNPDVIHCNDWHTGMVPQIIQNISGYTKLQKKPRTIFTIHNLAYQGFSKLDVAEKLGLDISRDQTLRWDAQDNNLDFILQGIVGADYITVVSPKYAEEVQTPEFGEGLDEILKARKDRLQGILNGISYEVFNPLDDNKLFMNYTTANYKDGKATNKRELQKLSGLEIKPNKPLIGIISRLAHQKGLDLVAESIEEIVNMGFQVIILGTGDPQLEMAFAEKSMKSELKPSFKAFITFSEDIARKIYAGSDMFLIPSRYEPCGLTQLIAMKYGSVPVVRGVGGLYDTVHEGSTGFVFQEFKIQKMIEALGRALITYSNHPEEWDKIVRNGMQADFSWNESAKQYITLYHRLINL